MLEELFEKISLYKKNNWKYFWMFLFLNGVVITYLIYRGLNQKPLTAYVISYLVLFIALTVNTIRIKIITAKKINKIIREELMPYILHRVNNVYQISDEVYHKDEAVESFMISRYGSFKSGYLIKGSMNEIPFKFSFASNFISTGQSYQEIFSGTFITFEMEDSIDGYIQIRDKGRAEKNKKLYENSHRYRGEMASRYPDLHFYTNQDYLAEKTITEELIDLYMDIKRDYKKGLYLTITKNKLVIGIHNRKNLTQFSFFKSLNQDLVDKRVEELNKLDNIMRKVTEYIDKIKVRP